MAAPPCLLDLGVLVTPGNHPSALHLLLDVPPGALLNPTVGGVALAPTQMDADGILRLVVPASASSRPVIQNAGVRVFRDGRGWDRGAVVDGVLHYYEDDLGQYDCPEEVFAGCGAGLLVRRALLADVGAFDERFFAYYEDVDLSWRARLRGWRVVYVPTAVARHVHRGTTAGWDGRFVYYTERNRLIMLGKLAPAERAANEIARAIVAAARAGLASPYRWVRGRNPRAAWAIPRIAALASLSRHLPDLLADRARIQGRRSVSQPEIDRWLAEN